jgi:hypothetical protein
MKSHGKYRRKVGFTQILITESFVNSFTKDKRACILYEECFGEYRIQCQKCEGWDHEQCAGGENWILHYTYDKCYKKQSK